MTTGSLPADLSQFVAEQVSAGNYESESAVICEALRFLKQRENRLDELRREIAPALERMERGEGHELTADEVIERGAARLAARRVQS